MAFTSQQIQVGQKWSSENRLPRSRWWESERIKKHINAKFGVDSVSLHAGFNHALQSTGARFEKAISVGSGQGSKEMTLLRQGVVQRFECYEFSEARINSGRRRAHELGFADRITFHQADVFALPIPCDYDLVYWNNALHHMMDVEMAVRWSRERLHDGGYFAMDDFVGPTGFQWDETHLHYVNCFRARLPDRVFANPSDPSKPLPQVVRTPNAAKLWAKDPSEAADSGRILSSVRRIFPAADIKLTGGAIYHTGLNNILANLDEEGDAKLLCEALYLDDFMVSLGHSNYAVAIARR